MLSHRILLQSPEFAGFLKSRSFDQSRLVRDLAGMASGESPGEVVVGIMAGRYLERLDLTDTHTEKTRKRIAGILQRFCITFGGLNPHNVRTPLVSYWIRHQRWALDTQVWGAVIIERLWQFGMDTGLLSWNPVQGLKDDILGNGEKKGVRQ
jgi:hypothetical protein